MSDLVGNFEDLFSHITAHITYINLYKFLLVRPAPQTLFFFWSKDRDQWEPNWSTFIEFKQNKLFFIGRKGILLMGDQQEHRELGLGLDLLTPRGRGQGVLSRLISSHFRLLENQNKMDHSLC